MKAKVLGPHGSQYPSAPITQAKERECACGGLRILVTFVGGGLELTTIEIVIHDFLEPTPCTAPPPAESGRAQQEVTVKHITHTSGTTII